MWPSSWLWNGDASMMDLAMTALWCLVHVYGPSTPSNVYPSCYVYPPCFVCPCESDERPFAGIIAFAAESFQAKEGPPFESMTVLGSPRCSLVHLPMPVAQLKRASSWHLQSTPWNHSERPSSDPVWPPQQ